MYGKITIKGIVILQSLMDSLPHRLTHFVKRQKVLYKKRLKVGGKCENRFFLNESYKQQVFDNGEVDIDFDANEDVPI